MTNNGTYKLILATLVAIIPIIAKSQKHENSDKEVWEKQIVRSLSITELSTFSSQAQKLFHDALEEKLPAYAGNDYRFSKKLNREELRNVINVRDSSIVVDATTNEDRITVVVHKLNIDTCKEFRLLEKWTFDKNSCIKIQLLGIAPVGEALNDFNIPTSGHTLFWVSVNDMKELASKNLDYSIGDYLGWEIWNEYLTHINVATPKSKCDTLNKIIVHKVVIRINPDTVALRPDISNLIHNKPFAENIFTAALKGRIHAYKTQYLPFENALSLSELHNITGPTKYSYMDYDICTGGAYGVKKTYTCELDYNSIREYKILEEWNLNKNAGETNIKILGIAPLIKLYDDNGNYERDSILAWFRYSDVKNYIFKDEKYGVQNSIVRFIWDSYFTDYKKNSH